MKIVAKIPYTAIDPAELEKLSKELEFGYSVEAVLDADTQMVLLVM